MYELNQVSANCFYVESPAKIGIVKIDKNNICLIDSGSDKDAGRKVRQHIDANGLNLTVIYNPRDCEVFSVNSVSCGKKF